MKQVLTKLPKGDCWVHEANSRIRYVGERELPYIEAKYENILKENKIPYKKFIQYQEMAGLCIAKEFCQYWNPQFIKRELITLPIYIHMPDLTYRYYGKTNCSKAPTYESIQYAKETKKFVEEKLRTCKDIEAHNEQVLMKESCYRYAKVQLAGKTAKVCDSQLLYDSNLDKIEMDGDRYRIVRVDGKSTIVAIFDMRKISILKKYDKTVLLNVPKHIAGLVIGKKHRNINKWKREIEVNEIRVIPI